MVVKQRGHHFNYRTNNHKLKFKLLKMGSAAQPSARTEKWMYIQAFCIFDHLRVDVSLC